MTNAPLKKMGLLIGKWDVLGDFGLTKISMRLEPFFRSRRENTGTFAVPPPVCAVPVLVINPCTEGIEGFNIYRSSRRGSSLNVAHADDASMEYWRMSVFIPLEIGRITRESIRCPF